MKIGFIGTGNMGGALAKAASKTEGTALLLANRSKEKAEKLAEEILGDPLYAAESIKVCEAADAADADYIFLGVKPQMMADMLAGLQAVLADRTAKGEEFVLVTMAAGLTMKAIREMAGGDYPVIRIMPNTPAAVAEGMILYSYTENVSEKALQGFLYAMQRSGRLSNLDEKLIDAGSAVSGCGPAFAYMFAEALADGGVACGLPRQAAIEYAAQMLLGSAKMILESGEHPGKLKDNVCSPGGTTIQGVRALEEGGFRGTVMDAVIAAYDRTLELKK